MEVHHHAHTARKKWTHYIWEFLMLFLAVFCGFLAENQREHMIEHKREHQYMVSLLSDLKTDTARLAGVQRFAEKQINNYDSLLALIKSTHYADSIRFLYYYFLPTTRYDLFNPSRRTIDQLENSGGMRLIRNEMVSDSITDYYLTARVAVGQGETWLKYFDQYHEVAFRVFDYSQIETSFYSRLQILTTPHTYTLLTNNPVEIKLFFNKLFALRFILFSYMSFVEETMKKGIRTLEFLKKEYHLQ